MNFIYQGWSHKASLRPLAFTLLKYSQERISDIFCISWKEVDIPNCPI